MFLGDHQHTLDAKGRVSLPAKFRADMTGRLMLVRGMEGCLYVYPSDAHAKFLEKLGQGNDFDPGIRTLRRFFAAGTSEVELDSAGRISIPQHMREHAKLEKEVSVIGNFDRIEIWDSVAWANYNDQAAESIESIASDLAANGRL